MALQTNRLSMVGLGVHADAPPVGSLQPTLVNGVHLRWAMQRALGFPWTGFYLFRRPHTPSAPVCLTANLGSFPAGGLGSPTLGATVGTVTSDTNLVFTEAFAPATVRELDLEGRSYVQVEPPEPAYGVDVKIGLRQAVGGSQGASKCVKFDGATLGKDGANPFVWQSMPFQGTLQDTGFQVFGAKGPLAKTEIRAWPSRQVAKALVCGRRLRVLLPCTAKSVEVKTCGGAYRATIAVFNAAGKKLRQKQTALVGEIDATTIAYNGITAVEIRADPRDQTARGLVQICFTCATRPAIEVTAYSGTAPVARGTVSGAAGKIVPVSLRFDRITSVRIGSGPASLVELCFLPVAQKAKQGWQPVSPDPNPISLPVRDPAYPCNPLPPDQASSRTQALSRVHYGTPASWTDTFDELHPILRELVVGGPTVAMAARSTAEQGVADPPDSDPQLPKMPRRSPLDLVLLGALHPAIAQMVGLYWVDPNAVAGTRYDYLVVTDKRRQQAKPTRGRSAEILREIAARGFTNLDGFIAFDLVRGPGATAPLPPPQDARSYALTGTTIRAPNGDVKDATLAAGLRWSRTTAIPGTVLRRDALMFHVWRAGLGNGAQPSSNGGYARLTTDAPVLLGDPPPGVTPTWPEDGPPFRLYYVDSGLAEGWYGYKVSGIDIFGRESAQSPPARWFGWKPTESVINPAAVQLLDKGSPPIPTAVEAYALVPDDPWVQKDTAYEDWFAALLPGEPEYLKGLRVRWKWTTDHMRQAPDTTEFRIYFNPGSTPPPYAAEPVEWQERYFVVQYDEHVTVATDTDGRPIRNYEILIPPLGDTVRRDLPLEPSLEEPVVYANVGVAAADGRPHTADAPKWAAGSWGGRYGNEGRVGPPATIYRVLRTKPSAPVVPADSERVYASPADYHSRSFYTYRWLPATHLRTHVYRALDESLFAVDWAQRPKTFPWLATLFPSEAVEPRWKVAKRQQIATQLDKLNAASSRAAAYALYRAFGDDELRILAGLPGNELASSQLTIEPLDPDEAANADRRGPDSPDMYVPSAALRAYVDSLDGRSTGRYFYRAAYVDGAHNLSPLSLSGPPVYLPDVIQPAKPAILKALGGERSVELEWAPQQDKGLARFCVYRSASRDAARDVRLMALAGDLPATELAVGGDTVDLGQGTDVVLIERVYDASAYDPAGDPLTGQTAEQFLASPEPASGTTAPGLAASDGRSLDGTHVVVVYRDSKQGLQVTPAAGRPLTWVDAELAGPKTYYYRVVAMRLGERADGFHQIESEASDVATGRAIDTAAPAPPTITTIEWVRLGADGTVYPYDDPIPAGETRSPAVRLQWTSPDPALTCLVQYEPDPSGGFTNASGWLPRGAYAFVHRNDTTWQAQMYRIKVVSEAGNMNGAFAPSTLSAAP